ncbi:MAG: DUF4339 domain-containing protein [Bacteroidales bacterium]|nr:DUF4339 domain-containing protein [Bacteroidales bacterium]MDY2916363.1 DUF4339 domain-containing protein [Muribaculaceae bacterium]
MDNNFSSLDRLMEFGMSMGVATQMMNVMNSAFKDMQVPNAGVPVSYKKPGFFAVVDDHTVGPLTDAELQTLVQSSKINADTFVWREGMPGWEHATDVPEVYKYILLNSPAK